jgi:RNA polymerase sigma factor (sigma-70 family)
MRIYLNGKIPKYLRSKISADDILQDVWVAAFQTMNLFRAERDDSLDRWLTSLANHALIDRFREAKRVRRGGEHCTVMDGDVLASSFALMAQIASPGKTPSRVAASSEAAVAIHEALGNLSEQQQRAVRMMYIEGKSRQEIARALQKTEAAVGSLLFTGLRHLKNRLGSGMKYFSDVLQ